MAWLPKLLILGLLGTPEAAFARKRPYFSYRIELASDIGLAGLKVEVGGRTLALTQLESIAGRDYFVGWTDFSIWAGKRIVACTEPELAGMASYRCQGKRSVRMPLEFVGQRAEPNVFRATKPLICPATTS